MKKTAMLVASIILLVSMGMSAMAQSGKNSITASWTYWNRPSATGSLVEKPTLGHHYLSNGFEQQGFTLTYDRKWTNVLDWGVYLGISKVDVFKNNSSNELVSQVILPIGFSLRAHILPLVEIENNQWDVYARGKIGGTFFDGFGLDWGVGMGVQYFPWKYIGITAEANFGGYDTYGNGLFNRAHFQSQLGVTFRW